LEESTDRGLNKGVILPTILPINSSNPSYAATDLEESIDRGLNKGVILPTSRILPTILPIDSSNPDYAAFDLEEYELLAG